MRVYAVLDIKAGKVVHAVAGQRECYRPVHSALTPSAQPGEVARAIVEQLGITHAYVADLDALAGQPPDLHSLNAITQAGMRIVLDAGIHHPAHARPLLNYFAPSNLLAGLVVPLETATSDHHWPELVELIGSQRALFSLDLRAGKTLAPTEQLASLSPSQIAQLAWSAGFRRLIVLDLHSVGTGAGPSTLELCHALGQQHAWQELVTGGGLRNPADLNLLAEAGCHGALVASALHRAEACEEWRVGG